MNIDPSAVLALICDLTLRLAKSESDLAESRSDLMKTERDLMELREFIQNGVSTG